MTFIGHYMRKSPCNIVILRLLIRDRSVKFSRMVAAGVIGSVYWDPFHELISRHREDGLRDAVDLFMKDNLICKLRNDIIVFISVFIKITNTHRKNIIIYVIYRRNSKPHADLDIFSRTMQDIVDTHYPARKQVMCIHG
jgi:hypothetical protein